MTPPVAAIAVEAAGILARIDQARGREDLHQMQAPQVLERLAAHARFDVWPWTLYLLRIIDDAYAEFEARVVAARELTGQTKVEQVRHYVLEQAREEFRFVDIVATLPDISHATIRKALNALAREGAVEASRGRSATWRHRGIN